ncbi:3-hydroxyacyl-ACP dehydratase FabZ family protein [Azonexus hydrophilus]|jgi:3-hydroxymyristoyl/3-hydroxydecanoyl-(acyl carrier protein) dehydratase|uniref:3-hydroxyacyl-ACP dehydratase FabZ family protein n=1 Tax=Azonexus hydrophilus TaxID=418702 RepID=UPI000408F47E|nr:beta-hydroxyacyl-ACP dehydratase [Azonexus hydrophilus]MBS4018682.1 beta-hydroxyacyl-ACP dehydratase [Dechloromonas sp.]
MTERQAFTWQVPVDHPAFAGHFPGRPIVPGVVLLDRAMACAETWLGRRVGGWQVGNAKFLSPVGPGETLVFTLGSTTGAGVSFSVHAGERLVASGNLTPSP